MRFACGTFVAVLLSLFLLEGSRVVFTNDEGIILDAAQRMVRGERLYVDFFGYMSPGGYWLQSAAFRLFGINLPAARAVVFTDFALQSGVVAWLVARFASRRAAIAAVFIFVGLHIPQPGLLTAQHRWDSAALAILSAALAVGGWWILAGACAAMAAICTPSVALVFLVSGGWLVYRRLWPELRRFCLGGLLTGSLALLTLAVSGSLGGFLAQMRWLREHYSEVNVMPYGSIIGGWSALFAGHGIELALSSFLVLGVALPALLPVITVPWAGWLARQQPWFGYLALVIAALVASAFPRADVMHLAFFVALPLALAAILLAQHRWSGIAGVTVTAVALLYMASYAMVRSHDRPVTSPVGNLRSGSRGLAELLERVRPESRLYVHPYMPIFYLLTQTQNPSRYSYLAPGMMGAAEEQETLTALESAVPEWVLYMPLTRTEFLRVFPQASGLDNRFQAIEAWIERQYVSTGISVEGYQLLQRRTLVTSAVQR